MLNLVASYPKSGNTWVRMFLMAYFCPEAEDFHINQRLLGFWQDCEDQFWQPLLPGPLSEMHPLEILTMRGAAFVRMIHAMRQDKRCKPYIKTHACNIPVNHVEIAHPPWLFSKCLYIIRDPRDIVVSFSDHMAEDHDTIIKFMMDPSYGITRPGQVPIMLSTWSNNVLSWTRENNPIDTKVIRFEDLRANPEKVFSDILAYFKIKFDGRRFGKALELTSLENLRTQEDGEKFAAMSEKQERFFRTGKVGGWKEVLTPAQVNDIMAAHSEQMKKFGYGS